MNAVPQQGSSVSYNCRIHTYGQFSKLGSLFGSVSDGCRTILVTRRGPNLENYPYTQTLFVLSRPHGVIETTGGNRC